MDLAQLRTLQSVAELGSVTKAAQRLNVAQPALSRQIRLLEEELGVQLFARNGRGMVLTEGGRKILAHASSVLSEVDRLRLAATERAGQVTGSVAIGMPPTVTEVISVPLVRACRETMPGVSLRLVSAFTGYVAEWLARGEIDVAILYDPPFVASATTQALMTESLFLVGSAEARFSLGTALSFSTLAEIPLLLPSPRHGLRAIVEGAAAAAGISLRVALEADALPTLRDLVRHGFGATILPLAPVHAQVVSGELTACPLVDPAPTRRIVLAHPGDRQPTPAARIASEAIAEVVTRLVETGVWQGRLECRRI